MRCRRSIRRAVRKSACSTRCSWQCRGDAVHYFAYGSNMIFPQMSERCPSSRFAGIAVLPNHRLAFTRKSVKRGCGVADAVRETGQTVWGVMYDISEADFDNVDKSEGYRPGREKDSYWSRA